MQTHGPSDGPHADMYETRKITGSVGIPYDGGESVADAETRVEMARINRYAQIIQPAMSMILPTVDRIDRRVGDLMLRISDLEKFQRRSALFQTFVVIVTCVFFVVAYLMKK